MSKQQTLLIIVDWFAPGYKAGGPIRSSLNLAMALKDQYTIKVLTTDTDHGTTDPYPDVEPNTWTNHLDPKVSVYYAKKSSLRLQQLKEQIMQAGADYIYLNHVWSPKFVLYPLWLKWLGKTKSKIVLCPRGGLYDSALSVKKYKKTPLLQLMRWMNIDKHILFHATNDREQEAIKRFFPKARVVIADNLPTAIQTPFFACTKTVGNVKAIFIARIVPIKNLLFLLDALFMVKANISLTVVGPVEDEPYWERCQQKIDSLPSNVIVKYIGAKENKALHNLVQQHHLFVLPTTGENFGHSIFESFLAGRPVLISDQTPWLQLQHKQIGWDIPLANKEKFAAILDEVAGMDQESFNHMAEKAWHYAADYIRNPATKQDYIKLFS